MKKILYTIGLFIIGYMFTGCNDFLDPTPKDRISDQLFWKDLESANLYINSLYTYIPSYGNFGSSQFGSELTEGMTSMLKYNYTGGSNRIATNPYFVTADQAQGLQIWSTSYTRIRRVNEFLTSLEQFSELSSEENTLLIAQARFIRAFLYYQLLLRTNTVILYDALPTGNNKPLSPESECWDFVETDLNFAINTLPAAWDNANNGRITKGAAYALMSRAMLVAKRWGKAREAALEVINMKDSSGAQVYSLNNSYEDAFSSYFTGNKESVLEFRYQDPHPRHSFDSDYGPVGDWPNHGGKATPTQEMVEEYELATGGKADWSNWRGKTTDTPPYALLEPRFHASVLYNGVPWKGREIESFVGGKDGYVEFGFQGTSNGHTVTGYYLKKYLDESIADVSTTSSYQPWIEIRLAEVYLNLAEACAMLGASYETEANDAIRAIRDRVDLPYSNLSGEALLDKIKHERKVELAFEGFHYWDLRRWRDAHVELDGVRFHGMKITKEGSDLVYEYVDVDKEDRRFPERFYNFPIPPAEIANNLDVSQISGW